MRKSREEKVIENSNEIMKELQWFYTTGVSSYMLLEYKKLLHEYKKLSKRYNKTVKNSEKFDAIIIQENIVLRNKNSNSRALNYENSFLKKVHLI